MIPSDIKNMYWDNEARQAESQEQVSIEYARVEAIDHGEPVLRFTGETLPSQKRYVRLKSYIPEVGDRVMLINDVIQGGWATNAN